MNWRLNGVNLKDITNYVITKQNCPFPALLYKRVLLYIHCWFMTKFKINFFKIFAYLGIISLVLIKTSFILSSYSGLCLGQFRLSMTQWSVVETKIILKNQHFSLSALYSSPTWGTRLNKVPAVSELKGFEYCST